MAPKRTWPGSTPKASAVHPKMSSHVVTCRTQGFARCTRFLQKTSAATSEVAGTYLASACSTTVLASFLTCRARNVHATFEPYVAQVASETGLLARPSAPPTQDARVWDPVREKWNRVGPGEIRVGPSGAGGTQRKVVWESPEQSAIIKNPPCNSVQSTL